MNNLRGALVALTIIAGAGRAHAGTVLLPADNQVCLLNGVVCSSGVGHNFNNATTFWLGPSGLAFQGSGTLSEFASGPVSGSIPAGSMIPFGYDFTLLSSGEGGSPSWELTMEIIDGSTVWSQTFDGTYGPSLTEFINSGSALTTGPIANGDSVTLGFNLSMTNTSGVLTTIHIPAESSVDIGPATVPTSGTPEPSTGVLLGGCLVLLVLWKSGS
jgi:hypothetical protein